jgi:hypothetical protein
MSFANNTDSKTTLIENQQVGSGHVGDEVAPVAEISGKLQILNKNS